MNHLFSIFCPKITTKVVYVFSKITTKVVLQIEKKCYIFVTCLREHDLRFKVSN